MAAVAAGVVIRRINLAMAEGAVVLAAQEVKVLVLQAQEECLPSKVLRKEID
jgi:hypothetical protein